MRNLFRSMLTFCVMIVVTIASVLFAAPVRACEGASQVFRPAMALSTRHGPAGPRSVRVNVNCRRGHTQLNFPATAMHL